jgi:hypothetical protein
MRCAVIINGRMTSKEAIVRVRTRTTVLLSVSIILFVLTGCSSVEHGWDHDRAMGRYLVVDRATNNFGYKRMQYTMGLHQGIDESVREHGFPDFIHEDKNEAGWPVIGLFYVESDKAYIFEQRTWRLTSLYLKEHRPLTDSEKSQDHRQ